MIPEFDQAIVMLKNLERNVEGLIERTTKIQQEHSLLQSAYQAVCMERDSLKRQLENGKCNTDNKESEATISEVSS